MQNAAFVRRRNGSWITAEKSSSPLITERLLCCSPRNRRKRHEALLTRDNRSFTEASARAGTCSPRRRAVPRCLQTSVLSPSRAATDVERAARRQ
eukprot:6195144-Pleurochrysis_carterae.AAC.1